MNYTPADELCHPPVFDHALALVRLNGNEFMLRELGHMFVREWPHLQRWLDTAVASGEPLAISRVTHRLRSSVGIFCADEPCRLARELNEAARWGEREELSALHVALGRALQRLVGRLREFLANEQQS